MRFLLPVLLCGALAAAELTPAEQALMKTIAADTIRGHVSFLASDALEGRATPSKGLDIAAEYIASQYRRFGLQPAGDNGYFQTAQYVSTRQPMDAFELSLDSAGKSWKPATGKIMASASAAAALSAVPVVKVALEDDNTPLPAPAAIAGKAVVFLTGKATMRTARQRREALLAMNPAVVLTTGFVSNGPRPPREATPAGATRPVVLVTNDSAFTDFAATLDTAATLSLKLQAPIDEPVLLKNVIATLPGSDPALKDSYILLTAHYDHTGLNPRGEDKVNNGANDDASGVSAVLSLAEAFSRLPERPRRTLVFMTYFGEEIGLYGSRYYAAHPVFPLAKTVANLNFEHMGRTDDNEGDRTGKLTASGFEYTSLGDLLLEAGKLTGIEAWHDAKNSDAYFARSDNQPLADTGVPAITLCTAWMFPDYHRAGDEWQKLNYPNMERVFRTLTVAVNRLANAQTTPTWVTTNPKTAPYVKAYQALHPTN